MKPQLLADRRGYSLIEVLTVVAITGVVMVIAIPMMGNLFGFFRLSGDARSISNAVAVAKMRAASDFSRVRIYADLGGRTFKTFSWSRREIRTRRFTEPFDDLGGQRPVWIAGLVIPDDVGGRRADAAGEPTRLTGAA